MFREAAKALPSFPLMTLIFRQLLEWKSCHADLNTGHHLVNLLQLQAALSTKQGASDPLKLMGMGMQGCCSGHTLLQSKILEMNEYRDSITLWKSHEHLDSTSQLIFILKKSFLRFLLSFPIVSLPGQDAMSLQRLQTGTERTASQDLRVMYTDTSKYTYKFLLFASTILSKFPCSDAVARATFTASCSGILHTGGLCTGSFVSLPQGKIQKLQWGNLDLSLLNRLCKFTLHCVGGSGPGRRGYGMHWTRKNQNNAGVTRCSLLRHFHVYLFSCVVFQFYSFLLHVCSDVCFQMFSTLSQFPVNHLVCLDKKAINLTIKISLLQ